MQVAILAAAALVAGATGCSPRDTPAGDGGSDAQTIAEMLATYDEANNRGNLDGLMVIFADDAIMMGDGPEIVGKTAIREVIGGWVSAGCSVTHKPTETESYGAVVISRGNATGTCRDGSSFDNKYLHVYQRQPDGSLRYRRGAANTNRPAS